MGESTLLRPDERALIVRSMRHLEQHIRPFEVRDAQRRMTWAVAEAFGACIDPRQNHGREPSILCVSAGTGTGKTVAFGTAGIVMAKCRSKRLVISCSTVTLQQQIVRKDLPVLQRALPVKFSFTIAKGRARYACNVKLMDLAARAKQSDLQLDGAGDADRAHAPLIDLAKQLSAGEWDGDRDHLAAHIDDRLWDEITTDRLSCAGSKCHQFARCGFFKARQTVKAADVIVVNHDLLLAALATPAGTVLPDPADTLYVLDEAHAINAKAVEQFASRHSVGGAAEWLGRLASALRDTVHALRLDAGLSAQVERSIRAISEHLDGLKEAIDATGAFDEKPTRRFRNGVLPRWAQMHGQEIARHASALLEQMLRVRELMLDRAVHDAALVQRLLSRLGFYVTKLESLAQTWALMMPDGSAAASPTARWIERHVNSRGAADYLVCAAPLSGAEKLTELLWRRASAVVATSATLTSCGTFDLYLRQTGLDRFPATRLLQLESPFDYRTQGEIVIPRMRSNPRDPVAHTNEVVAMFPSLIVSRATLFLFASGHQLREVLLRLPHGLKPLVKAQGTLPKLQIIEQHKAAVDRGETSIIMGTAASFQEGLDLAGEYLTHVVIVKLAFALPDSPLEEARREWTESQGRSAFLEISVPEAGVRLQQSIGRLIRTRSDFGRITILDRRVATTWWGRLLLKGLPPYRMRIFPATNGPPADLNAGTPVVA